MASSGMLRHVTLVKNQSGVHSNLGIPCLIVYKVDATWHNIPEDAILHSHLRENIKSYKLKYVLKYWN
jgi:hypothetical protein